MSTIREQVIQAGQRVGGEVNPVLIEVDKQISLAGARAALEQAIKTLPPYPRIGTVEQEQGRKHLGELLTELLWEAPLKEKNDAQAQPAISGRSEESLGRMDLHSIVRCRTAAADSSSADSVDSHQASVTSPAASFPSAEAFEYAGATAEEKWNLKGFAALFRDAARLRRAYDELTTPTGRPR